MGTFLNVSNLGCLSKQVKYQFTNVVHLFLSDTDLIRFNLGYGSKLAFPKMWGADTFGGTISYLERRLTTGKNSIRKNILLCEITEALFNSVTLVLQRLWWTVLDCYASVMGSIPTSQSNGKPANGICLVKPPYLAVRNRRAR